MYTTSPFSARGVLGTLDKQNGGMEAKITLPLSTKNHPQGLQHHPAPPPPKKKKKEKALLDARGWMPVTPGHSNHKTSLDRI